MPTKPKPPPFTATVDLCDLGTTLRRMRISAGLTQTAAAHELGRLDKGHLSRIETGKTSPMLSTAYALAAIYGYTLRITFREGVPA